MKFFVSGNKQFFRGKTALVSGVYEAPSSVAIQVFDSWLRRLSQCCLLLLFLFLSTSILTRSTVLIVGEEEGENFENCFYFENLLFVYHFDV